MTNLKKSTKVMLGCEWMRHPNTGLYTFCKQLANAIDRVKEEYNMELSCYLPEVASPDLPHIKQRIKKFVDKCYFRLKNKGGVFHATSQTTRRTPSNAKVVLTIHDLNFLYEKEAYKHPKYKRHIQRNIDKASWIVAISEFAKKDILEHLDIQGKPLDVIYNGCSFYEGEEIENPTYTPQREFLFTVGTVLAKKNFHVLPTLLVGNDYELVIAGNPSGYNQTIIDEAIKYGVEDRVKLVGAVTEAEKDYYYRHCKAFVFPSIAEGFGLPVIEALHYGKPTFISQHTSLPEIGKEYAYYFDYEFDREAMREVLSQGLEEFKNRDIEKQIAYAHSYSWENAARAYCEIYTKL